MAKKKTTRRKRKPVTKPASSIPTYNIVSDDLIMKFVIWNEDGTEVLGTIEDDVYNLHRLILTAQSEHGQGEDWVPTFGMKLQEAYNIKPPGIRKSVAYKIGNIVWDKFYEEKKSTNG